MNFSALDWIMPSFFTGTRQTTFLAIAARVVPEMAGLDAGARHEALALIEHQLAGRPATMRRELALFLSVIRWAPVMRYGRPFDRLDAARQDAVLGWLEDAPVAKLRSGFWGLKTLAFLAYYGRPAAGDAIGYRPSPDGWAAKRGPQA